MNPLASFLAALRFLTIIPITWKSERDYHFFSTAIFFFPLIGLIIGVITAVILYFLFANIPTDLRSVLLVFILAILSGFLHLDGLADSADGFLSARPKQQMLEIMRDSRIGVMGVLAIVFIVLLKITSLNLLSFHQQLIAVIAMPIAGRAAIVFSMAILPYARKEGGLGRLFYSKLTRTAAVITFILMIILSFYLLYVGFLSTKAILIILGSILCVIVLFSMWCKKMIGGATGDTLGAISELSETTMVIMIAIMQF